MHNLINRKAFCQEARAYSVEKYFKIFARERKESATSNEAAVFSLVVCQIQLHFLLYSLILFLLPFYQHSDLHIKLEAERIATVGNARRIAAAISCEVGTVAVVTTPKNTWVRITAVRAT